MDINEFRECLDRVSFADLGDATYFTDEMELYFPMSGTSRRYLSHDDFIASSIKGIHVKEIVEDSGYRMLVPISGKGKGSSGNGTFRFNHARDDGSGGMSAVLFPAEFNDGDRFQSLEKALDKFRERHADSEREYGITVDEDGYVHRYVEGGSTSVRIAGADGQIVIHNHPSGGAFSDSDLISTAQIRGQRGIIATTRSGDYIFEKTSKFDASGFVKAVRSARMKGDSYDDAVDKWLKANASKYGYRYRFRKA